MKAFKIALLMIGIVVGLSSCIVPVPTAGPGYRGGYRGGPVYRGGPGYGGPRHYHGNGGYRHHYNRGPRRY